MAKRKSSNSAKLGFEQKMKNLTKELSEQFEKSKEFEKKVKTILKI